MQDLNIQPADHFIHSGTSEEFDGITPIAHLNSWADYPFHLSAAHRDMLIGSAIHTDVAAARGYRTITTKADLARLGFAGSQRMTPTLLVPLWDAHRQPSLYHHRPDSPRIGKTGKSVKYEFPAGARMIVDVHPFIRNEIRNPNIPLFITEGAKKADAAISAGLCCVGLIGVWNFRGTNEFEGKTALTCWESIALNGRDVYICYDSDVMLKRSVHDALSRLGGFLEHRGANVAYIYLPHGASGEKVGLDDYLASGHTTDDLLRLTSTQLRTVESGDDDPEDGVDSQSASSKLLGLATDVKLFTDIRGDAYVQFAVGEEGSSKRHRETMPVRSDRFKRWLAGEFFRRYGKPAGSNATEDALRVIESRAMFSSGPPRELNVRVAREGDDIWLDLGDDNWRAIRIGAAGYEIVAAPPPLFRRHVTHASFPEPDEAATAADVALLRQYLNLQTDNDWYQLVAWLIAAWFADIPRPILLMHGEQGAAKSTALRLLGMLVDPTKTPCRSEPTDIREWTQAADHSLMIGLDNVSYVPVWLADALCRASTGEAFLRRKLYTDDADFLIEYRRVVAITSIGVVTTRSDVLDRSVILRLNPIASERRRLESDVLSAFERDRPRLFGAMLDLVSRTLAIIPQMKEIADNLPRMADFALVGMAVERVLGWPAGAFMRAYRSSISDQTEEALAGSLIADPIRQLVEKRGEWHGTATELLSEIECDVDNAVTRRSHWPKSPKSLSDQLTRIAPNLRHAGIDFEPARKDGHGRRILRLAKCDAQTAGQSDDSFAVFAVSEVAQIDSGLETYGANARPYNANGAKTNTARLPPDGDSAYGEYSAVSGTSLGEAARAIRTSELAVNNSYAAPVARRAATEFDGTEEREVLIV